MKPLTLPCPQEVSTGSRKQEAFNYICVEPSKEKGKHQLTSSAARYQLFKVISLLEEYTQHCLNAITDTNLYILTYMIQLISIFT